MLGGGCGRTGEEGAIRLDNSMLSPERIWWGRGGGTIGFVWFDNSMLSPKI